MTALIAAMFIIALAYAATASADHPKITTRISETVVSTWNCETKIGRPRTFARSPWKPHSPAFRRAELARWQQRLRACLRTLHAHDATIRRLQRGLTGTPMDGTAGELERAGRRWGISPYFIAGIAGTESSFGAAACSDNPYNAFGLSSCTTGWAVPYFRSWAHAYEFMGRFLSTRWPHARTTYDYRGYAKCSDCWGRKTAEHMRQRFGVGPEVQYA